MLNRSILVSYLYEDKKPKNLLLNSTCINKMSKHEFNTIHWFQLYGLKIIITEQDLAVSE